MHYTKEQLAALQPQLESQRRLVVDAIQLHAKVERLREAVAAVLDAYEGSSAESFRSPVLDAMFENLRQAAGIKAPPQDGDAGDRADDAYEREYK